MPQHRLNIVIALVIFFVPLGTSIIIFQLHPVCTHTFTPQCASPYESLYDAFEFWIGFIFPAPLFTLAVYGGLLVMHNNIPFFPHQIIFAFVIVLVPVGDFFIDSIPNDLSLITLAVYGLVLGVDAVLSRTKTEASTYAPAETTDA